MRNRDSLGKIEDIEYRVENSLGPLHRQAFKRNSNSS